MERDQLLELMTQRASRVRPNYGGFAIMAMVELERNGTADFLLLRNDDLRNWWLRLTADFEKRWQQYLQEQSEFNIRMAVWQRLSVSERKVLGITKPREPAEPTLLL